MSDNFEYIIIIAVILLLLDIFRRIRRSRKRRGGWTSGKSDGQSKAAAKGAYGEQVVATELQKLPSEKYKTINDLLIISNGNSSQIDHVVVSEYGIFVIETKFYNGNISGNERSEYWTQNLYGNKYELKNPVVQNEGHIKAIRYLLDDRKSNLPIISIVTFASTAQLFVSTYNAKVVYWKDLLATIYQYNIPVLTSSQVEEIYSKLIKAKSSSREDHIAHIDNVHKNEERTKYALSQGICPWCGGKLVLRTGQYGQFYGCSNYPACRYIHKIK